jgi:ATP-dependent RNA helicase DeaD
VFHPLNDNLSDQELITLANEAGFPVVPPLIRQIVPELAGEKDLLVETSGEEGKALALLLPALSRTLPTSKNAKILVLTGTRDTLLQSEMYFRLLSGKKIRSCRPVFLGKETQAKKELKVLAKPHNFIVGTPERIIDHLRRGNIDLSGLSVIVFDVPGEHAREGFEHDAEFILSKASARFRSVIFCAEPDQLEFLGQFHRRGTLLSRAQRESYLPHLHCYTSDKSNAEMSVRVLLSRGLIGRTFLLCENRESCDLVRKLLAYSGVTPVAASEIMKDPAHKSAGCIISHEVDLLMPFHGIDTILFSGRIPDSSLVRNIITHTGNDPENVDILVVGDSGTETTLKKLEEEKSMNFEKKSVPTDEEVLKGHIENILNTIKIDEDPDLLNRYRKLVRKHIPFFMRSYFAAYLLKESALKLNISIAGEQKPKKVRAKAAAARHPASNKQTLFVSIGKNRKVYPKDLVNLFSSTLSIEKEAIGSVKVLDNYSFVEIEAERSKEAVEKMDGMEFRGRKITVNYARKK